DLAGVLRRRVIFADWLGENHMLLDLTESRGGRNVWHNRRSIEEMHQAEAVEDKMY
ncbi:Transcription factor MTB3, partial [Dissostichus eleginoides]